MTYRREEGVGFEGRFTCRSDCSISWFSDMKAYVGERGGGVVEVNVLTKKSRVVVRWWMHTATEERIEYVAHKGIR